MHARFQSNNSGMAMTTSLALTAATTKRVFWIIATIDAFALFIVCIMMLTDNKGQHDGGAAMGWFFLFQVPAVILALSMALFHYTKHVFWHGLAIFIVASPVFLLLIFLAL